jgi:ATP-dependent Clp protease ATP-binding subunit ClpC
MELTLTVEDLWDLVAEKTGIPRAHIGKVHNPLEHLEGLEEFLEGRIVGQPQALQALCRALRNRAVLGDQKRPIGVFLFVGPSGVGKTETARALAEFLFGSEEALIRLDMSLFQEAHTISRLVGSPPGYVGYREGGELTEAIRRKRFAVLLLDEIEKAHPDVLRALLPLLDDGRLRDASGALIDGRNTLIIMTSNAGNFYVQDFPSAGLEGNEAEMHRITAQRAEKALRSLLPPEFLGRINQIVVFRRFSLQDVEQVIQLELNKLSQRVGVKVVASAEALHALAQRAYDPDANARHVQRVLAECVEPSLGELLLRGLKPHQTVFIDLDPEGEQLTFFVREPSEGSGTDQGANRGGSKRRRGKHGDGR